MQLLLLILTTLASFSQGEAAPIRGRILDRRTGEPVPNFEVSVELRRKEPVRLITNADGEYETPKTYKRTRYSLGLIDHARSPEPQGPDRARITHDPADPRSEVRIVIGPAFALDLVDESGQPVADPESFDAFLYHDRPLAESLPEGQAAPRAPVRETDSVWTRFRDRRAEVLLSGGPWWLEVRSLDGLRAGGIRIAKLENDPEPLRIAIGSSAVLEGRLVDAAGSALSKAALRLRRTPDAAWHERRFTEDDGTFRFASLEPGSWQLELCDPRARGMTWSFDLAGGRVHAAGDLSFERLEAGGILRGRLTSKTALYEADGELVLEATDKELFQKPRHTLDWSLLDSGQLVADIAIEVPAADRYRLRLLTLDRFDWGVIGETDLQQEPFAIVLDDRTQDLRFEIIDATTREPLENAELAVSLGLYNDWFDGASADLEDIPKSVRDDAFSWCVTAEGYRPRFGDLSPFPAENEDGLRVLELALEPGWGNRFEVFDRRTLLPLEGVEIRLDAQLVGTTNTEGLDVFLQETPTELDLQLAGWQWVGGSEDYRRVDLLAEESVPLLLWMTRN